ncbi:lambda-exonuclease family protein [Streptomyces sp. MJP52]|uniref:YqaJ viral recombinase family nuclease n=1 Tax=Streptomyces sp. MJP52 TaxID=2940555 RepID=UPI002475D3E0|nr:YqaJ viral recombinase family protein [Streptomyces sp. MJP52]MDH6224307.1 putative phage-type endonuclease [Streptomyces sp. MJP52]
MLTTMTGVHLGRLMPGTPEWDAARAGLTITATEIAAVLGLSPWMSRFTLWHKKAGLPTAPFEPSPQMEWGNRLEPDVAQKFAEEHPEYELHHAGTWQHRDRTWQRATPDRLLALVCGTPVSLLEIKTADKDTAHEWGPDGSDQIPVYYRCQVIWQQSTLGLTEQPAHLAVLIGGNDYREYLIPFDADDAQLMVDAAEEFLATVENGERPDIDDSTSTYQTIRVQPEGRDDVEVEVPEEDAVRYELALEQARAAERELTGARSVLLDWIGHGRYATAFGRRIATRTVRDGKTHSLLPIRQKDAA